MAVFSSLLCGTTTVRDADGSSKTKAIPTAKRKEQVSYTTHHFDCLARMIVRIVSGHEKRVTPMRWASVVPSLTVKVPTCGREHLSQSSCAWATSGRVFAPRYVMKERSALRCSHPQARQISFGRLRHRVNTRSGTNKGSLLTVSSHRGSSGLSGMHLHGLDTPVEILLARSFFVTFVLTTV